MHAEVLLQHGDEHAHAVFDFGIVILGGVVFVAVPVAACFRVHAIRPLGEQREACLHVEVRHARQPFGAEKIHFREIHFFQLLRCHFQQAAKRQSVGDVRDPLLRWRHQVAMKIMAAHEREG